MHKVRLLGLVLAWVGSLSCLPPVIILRQPEDMISAIVVLNLGGGIIANVLLQSRRLLRPLATIMTVVFFLMNAVLTASYLGLYVRPDVRLALISSFPSLWFFHAVAVAPRSSHKPSMQE